MSKKTQKDWQKVRDENPVHDEESIASMIEDEEESTEEQEALLHPSYQQLEEQLTLAEQKAHESWEKAARAQAELENVRRRAERDVANAHRYALEKMIESLLPVVDSLEQALALADEHTNPDMQEGLKLTSKLFLDVLNKQGVEQLNPIDEAFNPQFHEAMSMQESTEKKPNTILAVFQKGYTLHDRVIRPARVIVAKAK